MNSKTAFADGELRDIAASFAKPVDITLTVKQGNEDIEQHPV